MNINKFNYESFALDYLEGTLSPEMAEEMDRFLETHPAIEAELSGMMEFLTLEPDTSIIYEAKESLLKEEKVVWLSRKWVRPLMAAASILLLLSTFFVGYQAGVNQGGEVVVAVESSSISVDSMINKEVKLPVLEKIVPEKVEETIVKNTSKPKKVVPFTKLPKLVDIKEKIIIVEVKEEESTPLQLIDNELIVKVEEKVIDKVIIKKTIKNIPFLDTKIEKISSNSFKKSSLEKALKANLIIDERTLANYQKRKRSFKDLLGKFPVNNLKEALIPSYYREDTAGQ